MAHKRMFSMSIVDTDAFFEMPATSQLLYFHLSMRADDEGFVGSPKKIMKMGGFQDDDMKILLSKRFLLCFESGVVVIKHWLIHNTLRKDRFTPTTYSKERESLCLKENNSYSESGNQMATSGIHSIEEKRREEYIESANADLVYEPLKGNKTTGAFRDRARAKLGKPPMLKKNPEVWRVINFYQSQYKYITGKGAVVADADYFHIATVVKKMSPEDMDKMIVWYVKLDNKKFLDHPSLKSIFTVENINKWILNK